jgi:hypothetical protein
VYTQSPNDPNTEKRILKAVNEILLVIQASRTKVDDPTNPFNDPGADFIPEPTKPQIPFRQVDGDLLKGKKPGTRPGQPTYPPPAPLPDREPKGTQGRGLRGKDLWDLPNSLGVCLRRTREWSS